MLDRQVYLNIDSQNFVTTDADDARNKGKANESSREDTTDINEDRPTEKQQQTKHRLSYMKLPQKTQNKVTFYIILVVSILAIVNVPQHPNGITRKPLPSTLADDTKVVQKVFIPNILICMMRIVSAIVCPLIMIVLPASFYYYTQQELAAF